jgi:hypothetical protein
MPLRWIEVVIQMRKQAAPSFIGPMPPARHKVIEFPYCSRHSRVDWWLVYDRRLGVIGRANVKVGGKLFTGPFISYARRRVTLGHSSPWAGKWRVGVEKKRNRGRPPGVQARERRARQLAFQFEAEWIGREDSR